MSEKRDCLLKSAVMKSAKGAAEKFSRLTTQTNSPGREKSVIVPSNGIVVFDNESTTVEVTVKTKGRKSSPSVKAPNPANVNKIELKKSSEVSVNSHNHWSKILREHNQSTLRQTMQQLTEKTPSKSSRPNLSENKEARRSAESRRSSKLVSHHVKSPSKQTLSQKKMRDHAKPMSNGNLSGKTMFNSPESVIVMDKGVQCGGIFDKSNDNFGQWNPVRTLGFLMKEMESIVDNESCSNILTQMEQALMRIPVEQGNQPDLATIASKAKLEATTAKLAVTSKTIGESYKATLKDNAILQQHIQELSLRLKQSKQRQNEMEFEMKRMRVEMNDVMKSDHANKKIMNELREKIKQMSALEEIASDKNLLEKELKQERELLQQKQLEIQYLQLEKAKLSGMSSFRNSQLVELRNSIKNLQNNIADQLANLKDFPIEEEFVPNPDHHSTVIAKGVACSSPTRTSSNNSIAPLSWRGVSELSLSSGIVSNNNPERSRRQSGSRQQSTGTSVAPNDSDEEKFDEKTHLEFTSITGDKSTHYLNSAINNNDDDDAKFMDLQSADEVDSCIRKQNLSSGDGINNKSGTNVRVHKRRKKSRDRTRSQLNKSNSNSQLRSPGDKTLIAPENLLSVSSMYQEMKGQLHQMFENMKMKGRMPVNVPEPPRKFPNPEWSDSSLPTMSITGSNII